MNHTYHLTRTSKNVKTGPIPVSTTSADSCPSTCSFKGNGCYAEGGPLAMHWRAVSSGKRGVLLDEFCEQIKALPKGQLWRHNQAGDLPVASPKEPGTIDWDGLSCIAEANTGRRGFTYTHHLPCASNLAIVEAALTSGFTVNWSAESLEQVDEFKELGCWPIVCTLPADQKTATFTPGGIPLVVCPAVLLDDMDCARCGLCQNAGRKSVVGFPAHGSGAKRVQKVFFAHLEK